MGAKLDLTGKRFGRLVVIKQGGRTNQNAIMWICECDCGNIKEVSIGHLTFGDTKSCGCLATDSLMGRVVTHNKRHTPEYIAWAHMKTRCYNVKCDMYYAYGGRGIRVCDRWLNSFENFYSDMGNRPSKKHSLDRFPNVNGDYEPTNCRWATTTEQAGNRTNNKWIECNGKTMILADWSKELGVNMKKLHHHLKSFTIKEIVDMVNSGGIIDKRTAPYNKTYYKKNFKNKV